MNVYYSNPKRNPLSLQSASRRGITIVEVLTSIVVALIGVTGVLVLIPFGIRQAETGLDLEDSTSLAENAMARFQIEGYGQVSLYQGSEKLPWIDATNEELVGLEFDPNPDPTPMNPAGNPAGYYLIDPLWLASQPNPANLDAMFDGDNVNEFQNGAVMGPLTTPPFQPRHVGLMDLSQPPIKSISLAIAARTFVSQNDLQFAFDKDPISGLDIDDLAPPQPYVDLNATGQPLRRQFGGSISWSAIAVPKRTTGHLNLAGGLGTRAEGFDFYILAYKDRNFEDPTAFVNADRDPRFKFAQLRIDPPNVQNPSNPPRIFGTGTIVLENEVDIRSDEWVMLVNYDMNAQVQVGFYRVIGSDAREMAITIDGSDFIIQDFLADGTPNRSPTYAVYLPNVVSVFKRQLAIESESNLGLQ